MMIKGISRVIALLVFSLVAAMAEAGEGVIEINQALVLEGGVTPGDDPGFPVTIDTPGSYALTGNLTVASDVSAVEIAADNVALDLAGFSVRGSGGGTDVPGVSVRFDPVGRAQAEVRNGFVEDFSGWAVLLGTRGQVLDLRVRNSDGIRVTGAGLVRGNTMISNENGIFAGIGTRVEDNFIEGADTGIKGKLQSTRDLVIDGNMIRVSRVAIDVSDSVIRNNSVDVADTCIRGQDSLIVDNMLRDCLLGISAGIGTASLRANWILADVPLDTSTFNSFVFLGPNQCNLAICE